jgi:hypothetical protein
VSGAARDSSRKEGPQEDPGGTRAGIKQDSEPGSAPLTSRAGAARRFAGRGTLAQNPQTLLRLQRTYGNTMVQRLLAPAPTQTAGPGKKPVASELIAAGFPHLATALASDQKAQIQQVLDASYRIRQLEHEFETKFPGTTRFLSENAPRIEAIRRESEDQSLIVHRNRDVFVPTQKLLSDDVLVKESGSDVATRFREELYSQLISLPTRVRIQPEALTDRSEPLVKLIWGPNNWEMTHQGGLITFRDLLQIQKFSMPYMLALQGRKAELELGILEMQRKAGRIMPGMEKKKLGEIYDPLNNRDVRIGWEKGRVSGYADDPRGQIEMYGDLRKVEGARAVLVGPGRFLHIFSLKPSFNTWDLTTPLGGEKGTLFLLDVEREVPEVFLIETADYVTLRPGGKGWWTTGEELDITTRFAMGAILGDAIEDPSISSIIGQILIGLIPVVGQIADARDVAIGIHKMWSTGGKDGKLQTLLAAVGFIPVFGDALKATVKGGKKGIAALREAAPAIEKQLAKEILQNTDTAAVKFGLSTEALKAEREALTKLGKEALALPKEKAGSVLVDYATKMAKRFDDLGGNAGALVAYGGGKWADVTKTLAKAAKQAGDESARKLAAETLAAMKAWREGQVKVIEEAVAKRADEMAAAFGKKARKPKLQATGTASATSDLDMSFLGPSAARDRLAAIRFMEETFGPGWRDLMDAEIFVDPRRIHLFEALPGKARVGVEAAVLEEQKLNLLAKLSLAGADNAELARHAKTLGVDVDVVKLRKAEIAELTASKMLLDGTPMKEVEEFAKKAGIDPAAADPRRFRRMELDMDLLHRRFEAATTLAEKGEIAKEMALKQSMINSANEAAYATSGGVAKAVTRQAGVAGIRAGSYVGMSPAMGLEYVLDQLPMLQATKMKIAKKGGLDVGTAKAMVKYSDRVLVTAGQYGVAFAPGKAATREATAKALKTRELFSRIEVLLMEARKEPSKLMQAEGLVKQAMADLDSQLDDILKTLKENADAYVKGAEEGTEAAAEAVLDAQKAADLQKAAQAEKELVGQQEVLRSISILLRGEIRSGEEE